MDKVVSYEEVAEMSKTPGKHYLIDVREEDEINQTGLIPGSVNIPMNAVQQKLNNLNGDEFLKQYGLAKPGFDSGLIFTCRSGRRAEIIMKEVEKMGYSKCKYYAGSWLEWESKNKNN